MVQIFPALSIRMFFQPKIFRTVLKYCRIKRNVLQGGYLMVLVEKIRFRRAERSTNKIVKG